ncbi:MAG: hypothetical protein U0359_23560 [Byssovorax sp.]
MQQGTRIVFDEMLNAEGGITLYTSLEHTDFLSEADQLGLQAIFSTSVTSGMLILDVRIQHSGDGRNWLNKNTGPELSASITLTPGVGQWSMIGGEKWPTLPRLRFVTLAISMTTRNVSPPASRLQLIATARSRTKAAAEPIAPPPHLAPVGKREAMARLLGMRPSTLDEMEARVREAEPGDGLGRLIDRASPGARADLARITRTLRNLGPEQKQAALTFAGAFASLVMLPPDRIESPESPWMEKS